MRTQVWSCGGGTQSACIAAMICGYDLETPDYAVIADTGRERSSTWEYYERVLKPNLAAVGVDLIRVSKSRYATVDLFADSGQILLPVFTESGKMSAYCSDKWKRCVIQRWLREQGVEQCDNWLGFSTDEMKRVRTPRERWFQYRYPLIEFSLSRKDCLDYVQKAGWPPPPRSSCWMCPNMGSDEWNDIRENYPDDFDKAVRLESVVREGDPGMYFHPSRTPLIKIQHDSTFAADTNFCSSGYCFV